MSRVVGGLRGGAVLAKPKYPSISSQLQTFWRGTFVGSLLRQGTIAGASEADAVTNFPMGEGCNLRRPGGRGPARSAMGILPFGFLLDGHACPAACRSENFCSVSSGGSWSTWRCCRRSTCHSIRTRRSPKTGRRWTDPTSSMRGSRTSGSTGGLREMMVAKRALG